MPADLALGVVLSLLLDEGDAQSHRSEARERVLAILDVPLDPEEADEHRREHWGEDQRAADLTERSVEGAAGDFADVDLDAIREGRAGVPA